jgi:hypothetical protein
MKIDKAWHEVDIVLREAPKNRRMKSMVMHAHEILHRATATLVQERGTTKVEVA